MKLLLDGSLNQTLQLKDLLSGICQAEAPGLSVLKFVANKEECGEIYFLGGHYIVCARLSTTSVSGKAALDELLQVKEADFVYYACDSIEALPQESDNLKIELKELIEKWQEVKPVSEDQMLDKIFNVTATGDNARSIASKTVAADVESTEDSSIIPSPPDHATESLPGAETTVAITPRDDVDWDLVEPLVSSGAPGSGTDSSNWNPEDTETASPQYVRSMSGGFQWQRKLRKIFLFVIMALLIGFVIACGVWVLMNAPSAHLGPRRYPVPMEWHYFHKTP